MPYYKKGLKKIMGIKELKAKIIEIKEIGKKAKVEDKPALLKEMEQAESDLAEAQSKAKVKAKVKSKVKAQSQGITDFAKEYVKAKGTGLSIQGKAQRRIKGLTQALLTRQWTEDSKDNLIFARTFNERKFTVTMDKEGEQATLETAGKIVKFPLGKGAFKSVDYILTAYGNRYMSAKQVYEPVTSVVIANKA